MHIYVAYSCVCQTQNSALACMCKSLWPSYVSIHTSAKTCLCTYLCVYSYVCATWKRPPPSRTNTHMYCKYICNAGVYCCMHAWMGYIHI